jgi:hypothetical protein
MLEARIEANREKDREDLSLSTIIRDGRGARAVWGPPLLYNKEMRE